MAVPPPLRFARRRLLVPLLALLLVADRGAATGTWEVKERDEDPETGYVLYVSEGQTRYPSYKLETRLPAEPDEAVASLLVLMTSEDRAPDGQRRRVVRKGLDEVVIHTTIDMPVLVADRDVALRVTVAPDAGDGTRRVAWRTAGDEVPPPEDGVVRIPESSGFWEFAADGPGRSRAVYVTRSDIGGSIPAWIVSPMMRDQVAGDMQRLRAVIAERAESLGFERGVEPAVSGAPPDAGETR